MLTTAKVAASLGVGTHGSTYGGNALACAVAQRVVDTVSQPEILKGVKARSDKLRKGMMDIGERYGVFTEAANQVFEKVHHCLSKRIIPRWALLWEVFFDHRIHPFFQTIPCPVQARLDSAHRNLQK